MSGPKTESNGRIVKQQSGDIEKKAPQELSAMLLDPKMQQEIARALPKHVTPDRVARILMTALRTTANLAKCTPTSFMGCVLQSAQLGLEANTPMQHCWLIPRRNGKASRDTGREVFDCTLIIGYQGQIELSMRSGKISGISAQVVREGDFFEYELGLNPKLVHRHGEAANREEMKITHAYAVARIKDADPVFEVLSAAQLQARSQRSSSPAGGPWDTDLEAMCRKTAVRALWKWIPKSAEMAAAESVENAAERGTTSFDPTVRDALARHGLEPIDTTGESLPEPAEQPYDRDTGELREPGSDG